MSRIRGMDTAHIQMLLNKNCSSLLIFLGRAIRLGSERFLYILKLNSAVDIGWEVIDVSNRGEYFGVFGFDNVRHAIKLFLSHQSFYADTNSSDHIHRMNWFIFVSQQYFPFCANRF